MPSHDCRATDASFFSQAPERFTLDVELACTPERLFEILEDPASWPRWAPGIVKVEWTSPRPYGVGTTRTVSLRGGATIEERFDVWEPGRALAFQVERANQPVFWSFAEHYAIEPVPAGRCRLRWTVAYAPRDRFARLHPWVRPAMWLTLKLFTQLLARHIRRDAAQVATATATQRT